MHLDEARLRKQTIHDVPAGLFGALRGDVRTQPRVVTLDRSTSGAIFGVRCWRGESFLDAHW
jgi:hypothetical protein